MVSPNHADQMLLDDSRCFDSCIPLPFEDIRDMDNLLLRESMDVIDEDFNGMLSTLLCRKHVRLML